MTYSPKYDVVAHYGRTKPVFRIARRCYWFYLKTNHHVRVEGLQNIPKRGPVVIVPNHIAVIDSPLIIATSKRRVTFLAKVEYFTLPGIKGRLIRIGLESVGQLPVDRFDPRESLKAFNLVGQLLREGHVIAIHAEGTRSKTGLLYDMNSGFVKIARDNKAAIVPAALVYEMKDGKRIERVIYGAAIEYDEYKDMSNKAVAALVTRRIQKLSGQTLAKRFAEIVSSKLHPKKN